MPIVTNPEGLGLDPVALARLDDAFAGYVERGQLAGWQVLVSRDGRIAHLRSYGSVEPDTIFQIYSMTKPIVSVGILMLHEAGQLALTDPVSGYLPAFSRQRRFGDDATARPVEVRHLLTHTSGLSYGAFLDHPLDALYRERQLASPVPPGRSLAELVDGWAGLPLLFEPGTAWNYSLATDVLGRLIEVVSGQPLDVFLTERVFAPLGMTDTGFAAPPAQASRVAAMYTPDPATGRAVRDDEQGRTVLQSSGFLSGGGGLLSTSADYHRFARMLLGQGTLDSTRLLSPSTVEMMTTNQLAGGADLAAVAVPTLAGPRVGGVGFGLGVAVVIDPESYGIPVLAGRYGWGGAAGTAFFVEPASGLIGIFMTQLLPSVSVPARTMLDELVNADALIGSA